jgi:hypothetical protein
MRLEPLLTVNLQLKQPELTVDCQNPHSYGMLQLRIGDPSMPITCTVTAQPGFDDTVTISISPPGVFGWSPADQPCAVQSTVERSFFFGPAGGTRTSSFTVTCRAEVFPWVTLEMSHQAGSGMWPQTVSVGFSVSARQYY